MKQSSTFSPDRLSTRLLAAGLGVAAAVLTACGTPTRPAQGSATVSSDVRYEGKDAKNKRQSMTLRTEIVVGPHTRGDGVTVCGVTVPEARTSTPSGVSARTVVAVSAENQAEQELPSLTNDANRGAILAELPDVADREVDVDVTSTATGVQSSRGVAASGSVKYEVRRAGNVVTITNEANGRSVTADCGSYGIG